jgi:hypothetical protein
MASFSASTDPTSKLLVFRAAVVAQPFDRGRDLVDAAEAMFDGGEDFNIRPYS